MEIYECIISLLGGVGVFIFSSVSLSNSLQKCAGAKMKELLVKITGNSFSGLLVGALVTAIIQSSAATIIMTIGFVNVEVLNLTQAASIVMGANIGTTLTGFLASLESLNISLYLGLLSFIGVMMMFIKKDSIKNIGEILLGLGLIFVGLNIMSKSCQDEKIKSAFQDVFSKISFPLIILFLGIIFTAIMQSSSAMTGLVIVMVNNKAMEMGNALYITLGANVGTCVTAMISTIGATINAKRTGVIHLLFNVIGVSFFTIIIMIFESSIVDLLNRIEPNPAMQIAWFHLFFNIITSLLLLPFIQILVKISCFIIKDNQNINDKNSQNLRVLSKTLRYINKDYVASPQIGLKQVKKEINDMINLCKVNFEKSFSSLISQKDDDNEEITIREELIEYLNVEITKYLVKLSPLIGKNLVNDLSKYFHILNDLERIGSQAKNFLVDQNKMKAKKLKFSIEDISDLNQVYRMIFKMFQITIHYLESSSSGEFQELENLYSGIRKIQAEDTQKYFKRLTEGKCLVEFGEFFISTFAHFNYIASHLANISQSYSRTKFSKDDKSKTYSDEVNSTNSSFSDRLLLNENKIIDEGQNDTMLEMENITN